MFKLRMIAFYFPVAILFIYHSTSIRCARVSVNEEGEMSVEDDEKNQSMATDRTQFYLSEFEENVARTFKQEIFEVGAKAGRIQLMSGMQPAVVALGIVVSLLAVLAVLYFSCQHAPSLTGMKTRPPLDSNQKETKAVITALTVCKWADVDDIMSPATACEWSLSTPLRCHQLIRIQAKILAGTGCLNSPLSNQRCIAYTVNARRESPALSVLEVSDSIDLTVAPIDEDSARLRIAGGKIKLCNMMSNWYCHSGTLAEKPLSWQEKALSKNKGTLSIETVLDFYECILVVGCVITMIGELHRDDQGVLHLKPYEPPLPQPRGGVGILDGAAGSSQDFLPMQGADAGEKSKENAITSRYVLVSDDANLFVWG